MTVTVKILPSGREFVAEGKSTLLEAGLSAGLALGYGCSNGNCGKCLAKVVSGEVKQVKHSDFRMDPDKRASGHILMCAHTAMTDVIIEAPEASSREIPQQHITAKVRSISFVNDNVALVHLKTPRTDRLRFLAGQQVQLGGNGLPVASYSISSCPCDDMNLHFQIPEHSQDEFSHFVFNKLKKGDAVDVTGPQGDFVLDEDSARPLVFIAWHTGFAPIRSLIEHAMALDEAETMHLAWLARNKEDRYQDNLCRSWEDALDNFVYVPFDADITAKEVFDAGLMLKQLNIESG
jgi:CDP-4-dehydro-6-deoxyglucose reductase